jgi:membrane associated rhomboid family serine protease
MTYPSAEEQETPLFTPAVRALIAMNVGLLFLQTVLLNKGSTDALLGFRAGSFGQSWWSVVTYMFVHGGVMHLAFNMYTLWLFGRRLEQLWGTRRFTWFYLWCGLGGVVLHAIMTGTGLLIGASAAVFGVMFAYAWIWREQVVHVFGIVPVRVTVLVAFLAILNLIQGMSGTASGVAHFAHLGGFAFAFLYMQFPSRQSFEDLRGRISPAPDYGDEPPRPIPRGPRVQRDRGEPVDEIVARSRAVVARERNTAVVKRTPARAAREDARAVMDRLLDKISESGMESLSGEERRQLDEAAQALAQKSQGSE